MGNECRWISGLKFPGQMILASQSLFQFRLDYVR